MNGQEECAILTRSDVLCGSKFYYTSPSGPYPAKCACVLRSEDCKRSLTIAGSKQYRLLKGIEHIHITFNSSIMCLIFKATLLLQIILILICYTENVCTKQEHCTNYKIGRDSYVCKKTSDEKFGFCIEGIIDIF